MAETEELPQTDTLRDADVRWLRSEFERTREAQVADGRATRELAVALNSGTNTRLEEHHQRISAVEKYVATRDQKRTERKRRWTLTGIIAALITIGGALANVSLSMPHSVPH